MEESPGPESRSRETVQFNENTQAMIDTARNIEAAQTGVTSAEDRLTGPGFRLLMPSRRSARRQQSHRLKRISRATALGAGRGGCEVPQMPVHQNLQIRAQTGDRQGNLAAADATGEDRSLPLVCTTAGPGDPRETAEKILPLRPRLRPGRKNGCPISHEAVGSHAETFHQAAYPIQLTI